MSSMETVLRSLDSYRPRREEWAERLPLADRKHLAANDSEKWAEICRKREAFRHARAYNVWRVEELEAAWVEAMIGGNEIAQRQLETFVRVAWRENQPFGQDVVAWWHRRREWHLRRAEERHRRVEADPDADLPAFAAPEHRLPTCPQVPPLPTAPADKGDWIGVAGPCVWCAREQSTKPKRAEAAHTPVVAAVMAQWEKAKQTTAASAGGNVVPLHPIAPSPPPSPTEGDTKPRQCGDCRARLRSETPRQSEDGVPLCDDCHRRWYPGRYVPDDVPF